MFPRFTFPRVFFARDSTRSFPPSPFCKSQFGLSTLCKIARKGSFSILFSDTWLLAPFDSQPFPPLSVPAEDLWRREKDLFRFFLLRRGRIRDLSFFCPFRISPSRTYLQSFRAGFLQGRNKGCFGLFWLFFGVVNLLKDLSIFPFFR